MAAGCIIFDTFISAAQQQGNDIVTLLFRQAFRCWQHLPVLRFAIHSAVNCCCRNSSFFPLYLPDPMSMLTVPSTVYSWSM
jgi:hypothetical protein